MHAAYDCASGRGPAIEQRGARDDHRGGASGRAPPASNAPQKRFIIYTSGVWVLGRDARAGDRRRADQSDRASSRGGPAHEQLVLDAADDASAHGRRPARRRLRRRQRHRRRSLQVGEQRPGARRRRRQQSLAARLRPRSRRSVRAAGGRERRRRRLPRQRRRRRARQRHRRRRSRRTCRCGPTCATCRSRKRGTRWARTPTRWRSIRWSAARARGRSAGRRRCIRWPATPRGCSKSGARRGTRRCGRRLTPRHSAGWPWHAAPIGPSAPFARGFRFARRRRVDRLPRRRPSASRRHRLRLRQLARDDRVDQPVLERALRVEIEVGALGVPDDLAQRLARARRQDLVDLILHLLEPLEMLRRGGRRLPAGPLRRLVNHDPRVREGEAAPVAGRLQDDRAHRVRHPLHDDRDLDAAADDVADGVVDGEAVGDVAAGAVDVERDRPVVVVGELAQALDADARGVFLDVADQIDVAQPVARLPCAAARGRRRPARRSGDRSGLPSLPIIALPRTSAGSPARNKTPARG